jgi:hypothetical protein
MFRLHCVSLNMTNHVILSLSKDLNAVILSRAVAASKDQKKNIKDKKINN